MIGTAIILAAGRGRRMGTETADKPKCLAELLGRPLISWQTGALQSAGIKDIITIGGYHSEYLSSYTNVAFINRRWEETNMVATLAAAASRLQEKPCLVSYSDIVYHPKTVLALSETPGDIVISYDLLWLFLWRDRFEDPLDDAETFISKDGCLVEIGSKPDSLEEIQGQYMGLLKFTPKGWRQTKNLLQSFPQELQDRIDMTSLLRFLIEDKTIVTTVPIKGRWCEVDRLKDRTVYERRIKEGNWSHDWRWSGKE